MLRRRRNSERRVDAGERESSPVHPEDAPARWRPMVEASLRHRARFQELVSMAEPGPIRDRLTVIGQRIDQGVDAVWSLTRQGATAQRAVELTDPEATAERLKAARRQLAASGDDAAEHELRARVEALARSHAAAQRLCNSVEDLGAQLDMINARLAATVAQAAEVLVSGPTAGTVEGITRELDDVLLQLEATRRALEAVDQL